jgi:hypothetical protein
MSIRFHRHAAYAALIATAFATNAFADDRSEWRPLFNGRDLDGWTHVGPGSFVVENGQMHTQGGMGLLWYNREKLGDAVVRIVYRTTDGPDGGNSGVFIRIPEAPTEPWMPVNRGYEVQIDATDDDFHRTGVLYSFTKAQGMPPDREWNTMEITLDGIRTQVVVNGVKITDYREGEPVPEKKNKWEPDRGVRAASGYIGLQNHSDKDRIYFKDISVKPLKK